MRAACFTLIALLAAVHCSTAPRDVPRVITHVEREDAGEQPATNEALQERIEQISRGAAPAALRVRVDWQRSGSMTFAEVYGNGVGIYDDRIALRLSESDIRAVVRALVQAKFAAMPSRFGEPDSDFLKMRGRVTVDTDRIGKSVIQIDQGAQSEPLAILAAEILTVAERASRSGVTVASLPDALAQLASGTLPPETIHLTVQRRDDRPTPADPGWLLRLRGHEAIARRFSAGTGYGQPRRLILTGDEFAQIAASLRETNPDSLPANLYAPMYTDFRVDILGRSRDLLARPYSGIGPTTQGARQVAFDRLIERLQALAERVIRDGAPTAAAE